MAVLSVVVMLAPAAVATIAIVDTNLLAGFQAWIHGAATVLSSFAHARVFLLLPLAAMVARAKEDS